MSDTTEMRWFKIVMFIATGFFAGLFLANIIYFNRLRNGGTISNAEALSMLALNAILFTLALILFVWSLVRLLTTTEQRQVVQQQAASYLTTPGSGVRFSFTPASGQPAVAPPGTQTVQSTISSAQQQ